MTPVRLEPATPRSRVMLTLNRCAPSNVIIMINNIVHDLATVVAFVKMHAADFRLHCYVYAR